MDKQLIKVIMSTTNLTIEKWKEMFGKHPQGSSVSISSISNWRQGKQCMGNYYKNIFIDILCCQKELRKFENPIRQNVMKSLKLGRYRELYWEIEKMEYDIFLKYILEELNPDKVWNYNYSWNKISLPILLKICVRKAEVLSKKFRFQVQEEKDRLRLTYVHENKEKYIIIAGLLLGDFDSDKIQQECKVLCEMYGDSLLHYLFVTQEITDELYLKMLEQYQVYLLKIDFCDIDAVEVLEAYIVDKDACPDEEVLLFINVLADVILHKLCGMNFIVLKEILCCTYNYHNISEQYFSSNSGIWKYQYPIRRNLAFEEKLINQKLRMVAKSGRRRLEILDIDLTDGLLGVRCSFGARNVTCVDISLGAVKAKQCIIDRYNKVKSAANEGIDNVNFGYLRVDTMKMVGVTIPENGFDLIILGLGGGSYIPNLDGFLRQIGGWIKTGKEERKEEGVILLSVFNKDALCFSSSQAKMDFRYDYGVFRHIGDEWPLPAKLYSYKEICHMAMKYYDLLEEYSYPTVLSVVSENYPKEILDKLKEIDKDYTCRNIESDSRGLFDVLYLKKMHLQAVSQCYLDIKNYISENEIVLQTIQHEEITSKVNMIRELNRHSILAGDNFIKTVVLFDEEYDMLIFYLLPLNKKFSKRRLESWYENKQIKMIRGKLRLCREKELSELGLASGSISPFSYPVIKTDRQRYLFCDIEVKYSKYQIFYTYSGDLQITYKIEKNVFLSFLKKNNVMFR